LVAHAQAQEAGQEPEAFEQPADVAARTRFRGSYSGFERNALFRRVGPARYVECGFGAGLDLPEDGRAVAPFDLDGDGDLDLALLSLGSLRVLRNESVGGRWIRLRVRDAAGGPALGAVVRVGEQVDRVRLTAGFQTQTAPWLHFGLGAATGATVRVRWPSGEETVHPDLAAGALHELRPTGPATTQPTPRWPAESWPRPTQRPGFALAVRSLAGELVPLGRPGKPLVVNLFASWCGPCKRELPVLAGLTDVAPVVAVSVEPDAAKAAEFVRANGGEGLTVRLATDELVGALFGAEGRVTLPTTLVLDGRGAIRRAWHREVTDADLRAVLATIAVTPSALDHALTGIGHLESGREKKARAAFEAALRADPDDAGVLSRVGWVYVLLGDHARGIELLRKAAARAPWDAEVGATLSEALAQTGDLPGARSALEAALRADPRSPRALTLRAGVLLSEGRTQAAREQLRSALAADPEYAPARELRDRIGGGE
jgi:Flp pilus assembly protein TadD/thiol-disulfide isomerase/thioredoxin